MNRSISTAIALTLGIAVSAAVVVTVLAQKKQPSGTSSGPDRISAREAETPSDSVAPRAVVSAPALALAPASSSGSSADAGSDRAAALLINASGETGSNSSRTATPSEIEVDSSNIRMVPKSSVQPIAESRRELRLTSARQENSLAAALLDPSAETVPVWRPAYSSQGFRGARLDAFAISQDSSVLAIAERTGKAAGPNGTRTPSPGGVWRTFSRSTTRASPSSPSC